MCAGAARCAAAVQSLVCRIGGARLLCGAGVEHIGAVCKAVVIAVLAQGVQDLCQQAGQAALAGRVELAGKTAVLLAALPLLNTLAETLLSLLG